MANKLLYYNTVTVPFLMFQVLEVWTDFMSKHYWGYFEPISIEPIEQFLYSLLHFLRPSRKNQNHLFLLEVFFAHLTHVIFSVKHLHDLILYSLITGRMMLMRPPRQTDGPR